LNEEGVEIALMRFLVRTSNNLSDYEEKEIINIEINQQDAYFIRTDSINKDNTVIWEYEGYLFTLHQN
jgi:hypothetical protein